MGQHRKDCLFMSFTITFRKRPNIWLELRIHALTRTEARTIAEREIQSLRGYTYAGSEAEQ